MDAEPPGRCIALGGKQVAPVLDHEPGGEQRDSRRGAALERAGEPRPAGPAAHRETELPFVNAASEHVDARAEAMPLDAEHDQPRYRANRRLPARLNER